MRLLFVKNSLVWPRSSGHDVHTFYMMKACAELGHEVSLATAVKPEAPAIDGVPLQHQFTLSSAAPAGADEYRSTWLQKRFRSFWGVSDENIAGLRHAVATAKPDAVIVGGLDALPYFPAIEGARRIWYAADEWMLHHISQLEFRGGRIKEHLNAAAIKGLYERAHGGVLDRVWVVSEGDQRAMRLVAGVKNVDVLPNGVDSDFFKPGPEPVTNETAVFWGRLDFGPNIQALEWFCGKVWPLLRQRHPTATFSIIGFQPTDDVRKIASAPGIALLANLHDLRSAARRNAVAVMPFVSGAGIKNKLLEAAAMGMAIVGTPTARGGLRGAAPIAVGSTPQAFADEVSKLWSDPTRRHTVGMQTRAWVMEHHTWLATAREAMAALESMGPGVAP